MVKDHILPTARDFDVLITSYEMVNREKTNFMKVAWQVRTCYLNFSYGIRIKDLLTNNFPECVPIAYTSTSASMRPIVLRTKIASYLVMSAR